MNLLMVPYSLPGDFLMIQKDCIFFVNNSLPGGFIPNEDQGTIYAIIQTPPGATLERTNQVSRELQEICEEIENP